MSNESRIPTLVQYCQRGMIQVITHLACRLIITLPVAASNVECKYLC